MTQKNKKAVVVLVAVTCLAVVGTMAWKKTAQPQVTTQSDKSLYLIGQMLAQRTENLNLNEKEIEVVLQGFRDWAGQKKSLVPHESNMAAVQQFIDQRMEASVKTEKEKGKAFLEKFIASGGQKTPSGLAYKIVKPGSDLKPKPTDVVEVHYHGTLTDGTVFDSSEDRKEKAMFPLNQVIKGWTEGLQLIGEDGEIELVIPSELAYGDSGSAGKIPPGATLMFKIKLFKIKPSS